MSRSWWKWVQAADANDKAALQQLEDRLSMEEIAHFRAFVAAQSSKLLLKSETHLQHAVDAVDAVVANLGPLPQGVEALLLHSDNVAAPPVQLSLSAECPKLGITLGLAQDWPIRTNSIPDTMFYHLEAAVRGISADIRPTGEMQDVDKDAQKKAMLRPPGLKVQLRVAGVQLLYNSDLVGAALGFVNELQHHTSRVLEKTADAGDEPGRPRNLTERVLHSFARHDIPVDRPVSLPLISVDMYCPGVVFCIPYMHMNDVKGPDHLGPSTSASAQGDSYELIAALTRVRGILFGEDFQQFLRGGATQRFSLTTYLDLFCYQPPEHRKRELSQKIYSLPAAPGATSISVALAIVGMQVWLSPWQVSHVLSIVSFVESTLNRVVGPVPGVPPATPITRATSPDQSLPTGLAASAMKTQLKLTLSVEISLVSILCLVSRTDDYEDRNIGASSQYSHMRRSHAPRRLPWSPQIAETDMAFAWSKCLAPVYAFNLIGIRAACKYKGTGEAKLGAKMDGLLTRDLQIRPEAKFAFFIRPLPSRAKQLSAQANFFRRRLLKVDAVTKARRRWYKVVRTVVMRQRCTQQALKDAPVQPARVHTNTVPFSSFFGSRVSGPQLSLVFIMHPPDKYPGHPDFKAPPPAELDVEVGQILFHGCISKSNRMLPFTTQIIEVVSAHYPPNLPTPSEATSAIADQIARPTDTVPVRDPESGQAQTGGETNSQLIQQTAFPGLQARIGIVGVSLVAIVEGKELLSFKLLDATVDASVAGPSASSRDPDMTIGAAIQDMSIRDIQADPHCTMVLQPNAPATSCSLALEFNQWADGSSKPTLVAELTNPQFLLLFRFMYDIMHGVDIIIAAIQPALDAASPSGAANPAAGTPQAVQPLIDVPLRIAVYVTNLGIILPASSKSHQVLCGNIDHVSLGMPGSALSDNHLADADLPHVEEMVADSLDACCMFKRQASVPDPVPPVPAKAPDPFADITGDLSESVPVPGQAGAGQGQAEEGHGGYILRRKKAGITGTQRMVRAYGRMKNKLGIGQEDRYDYGHSGGPRGVIAVEVPNYQRHWQRQMPAHITGLVGQPLPKLPTPFAAAQVPLPDDNDDLGGHMPLSRAGPIPLADARALAHMGDKVKGTSGKRGSVALRQALMPGQAAVGGMSTRLGSAPPSIRPRPSFAPLPGAAALGLSGAGVAPRYQSAPHLDAGGLPESKLAILAEGFVVERAQLAEVKGSITSFVPASGRGFAHSRAKWGLADKGRYLLPSHYSMVMIEQAAPPGCSGPAYLQMHLASAPVTLIMNNPNYTALLAFCEGNLTELSALPNAQKQPDAAKPQNTTFNADFRFGPPVGVPPTFRMTLDVPEFMTLFEADPKLWQTGSFTSAAAHTGPLMPFAQGTVRQIKMDLVQLADTGNTHMIISADSISIDDLRLAYSQVMNNHISEQQSSSSNPTRSPKQAAQAIPASSPLVARVPVGVMARRKSDVGSRPADTSASDLRQSISARDVPVSSTAAQDRERARIALSRPSMELHRAHSVPGPTASTSPELARSKGNILPKAKRKAQGGSTQQAGELVSIISMEVVPELLDMLPDGAPVVHLVQCPYKPPPDEGTHLTTPLPVPGRDIDRIEVQLSVIDDGTLAIEATVYQLLAQWPYLSDLSLIWAAASIFEPASPAEVAGAHADPAHQAAAAAAHRILQEPAVQPWLYFNLIAHNSHVFAPVMDLTVMKHAVEHYFGGGSELLNMHERLADLLLIGLSASFEDGELGIDIEDKGLVVNWTTFRFAFCQGGDGESDMTMDVQDLAMFVRDPGSVVTCILLPLSCSMHMHQQIPQAENHAMRVSMTGAAVVIQRWWRHALWKRNATKKKLSKQSGVGTRSSRQLDTALLVAEQLKRPILRMPNKEEVAAMDKLIAEVASPRTKRVLADYKQEGKLNGDAYEKGFFRTRDQRFTRSMKMQLKVGACTVRAAFSHIPFWQSVMWMGQQIVMQPCKGNIATGGSVIEQMDKRMEGFQSSTTEVEATIQNAALVLCNDKPQTFGAPDVLQVTASQASAQYTMSMFFPDRPPNQAARIGLAISASFLNNSSSRWEAICESWAVEAEMVDTVSPIYRSDHHRHMWLASKERLNVHFNPASLLSFGDGLAFVNTLLSNDVVVLGPQGPELASSPTYGPGPMARLAAPENAPKMAEQMAVNADLTSRIPQKYLIQNQSGLRVYYWADEESGHPPRSFNLATGVSETLQVNPARRLLNIMMTGKHGGAKKVGNVINLHFEGNWMPIQDVAVSVVGKYCYHMHSPSEHQTLPVIVDIILVGRTKIITLHSSIWLTNSTDRHVAFRLHVPITPLVAPARVGPPNRKQLTTDHVIGPLEPNGGVYLPLTAVLGGLLFVRVEGYLEADRDVIRLDPSVETMQAQQGYVCCMPQAVPYQGRGRETYVAPLHCCVRVLPSQVNSEFQAFKHIESLGRGELMRATRPLEVTVAVYPTLVLTNALPYDMDIVVWQVNPFRKLRKVHNQGKRTRIRDLIRYDLRQMHAAFTGTLPVGSTSEPLGQQQGQHEDGAPVQAEGSWQAGAPTDFQPFESTNPKNTSGHHINVVLKPGASQDVYADLSNNLLVHVIVPALGLRSKQWTVISWARSQTARESLLDAKYVYRLSNQITLTYPTRSSFSRSLSKLNPKESIAKLKDAGRRVREHLQRPTLERSLSVDPLFRDEESDDIMRSSIVPSHIQMVPPPAQVPILEAEPTSSVTFQDTPIKLGGHNDEALSGSEGDTLPSISEVNMLQAPSPMYRRHASFTTTSTFTGPAQPTQPSPLRSPFVDAQQAPGPSAQPVLSDRPILSPFAEPPAASRRFSRQKSGVKSMTKKDKQMLRMVFEAWREYTVESHASRFRKSLSLEQRGGAPPMMLLGVDNSMHDKASGDFTMCRLTLFAPYWVDNRSGLDLLFKDGPSAKGHPLLMGAHTYFDYAPVKAPGVRVEQERPLAGANSNQELWDLQLARVLQVQPVLLNKQDDTSFALANTSNRDFSRRVQINTVGGKGSVRIKGPEPVHAGMLTEYMRHNLGQLFQPRGHQSDLEPQQPTLQTQLSGDDEAMAVHVSLEPVEAGGEVKLNLAALQQHEEPGSSLPAVRTSITSITSVSPRRRSTAPSPLPSPVTSDIQPLSESHQAAVMRDDQEIAECLSPSAVQEAGLDPLEAAIDLSDSEHSDQDAQEEEEPGHHHHHVRGQRQYEFAVEYGSTAHGRCARRLEVNERCAIHWDDAALSHELMVRPAGVCNNDTWHWSGGFKLTDREEYYGLRVRQEKDPAIAINIPVNTTVGPSGSLLVTFKSRLSVPPYRIENMSSDVVIFFAQRSVAHQRSKWNWLTPAPGGNKMAYAWDEPIQDHSMTIRARVKGRLGQSQVAYYNLDRLGVQHALHLPSMESTPGSSGNINRFQTLQDSMPDMPDDVKQRLTSLLAAEFSKKVYVSVYADGPTRVLRFADEKSTALLEAEQSILDLAARLKQVEREVKDVNSKFARLRGMPNAHSLDLYGRSFSLTPTPEASRPNMRIRRSGRTSQGPRLKLRHVKMATMPRQQNTALDEEQPGGMPRRSSDQHLKAQDAVGSGRSPGMSRSKSHGNFTDSPSRLAELEPEPPAKSFSSLGSSGPDNAAQDQMASSPSMANQLADAGHLAPHAHATPQTVQGSDLMRFAASGDATLLIGGDLIVTVCQAEGLNGEDRATHPFARARLGEQGLQTSVQWQTTSPVWEEALSFRQVTAAGELMVEVWDLGGTRGAKQLKKLADNPSQVIGNSRFLGRAEIPLVDTLTSTQRGSKTWYPLMRRDSKDAVCGRLKLAFAWDVTARSLMSLMLKALEHVLQQRREILCMLDPVSPVTALTWSSPGSSAASTATMQAEAMGHEGMAARIMAKHSRQEHRSSLCITIIEARGLRPRHGVAVAFQANDLPNPLVEVSTLGRPNHLSWTKHTLNPKFPATDAMMYDKLPSDTIITFKLFDNKGTLTKRRRRQLLGSNSVCCTHLTGEDPLYVWLPMHQPSTRHRRRKAGFLPPPGHVPDLQVLVRFQWVMEVMRGQSTHMEVSLEGLATSVMGGLQDELFNLTLDNLQASGHITRLEATLTGSIRRLQLDNQLLDATQPVVLASASVAHARSDTAQSLVGDTGPLISFGFTRSFANTIVASGESNSVASNPAQGNRSSQMAGASGAGGWGEGNRMGDNPAAILSFKDIHLNVGEMDFQADDGFLEAILSFVVSIPTADIWQDEAWRQQQRRLLTAQFGPKEVESLATNAVLPMQESFVDSDADPLQWIQEKELRELEVMRGHSSYTSWYFVERAEISNVNVNVTISLSSSILSTHAPGSVSLPENRGGLFSRVIGASGFQLINVNNVPLQLSGWSTDTKLIGRRALQGSLTRHYIGQSIKEAHKVLGGAGPAIAAVPLTVVWAGTSALSLLNNIRTRQVGPLGAVQRVGFVLFTGIGQIISAFSRMGAATMTYLPPNRTGHLTDRSLLTRAVQRPPNAPDAFRSAFEEFCAGSLAGLAGTLLDPVQGYHSGSFFVALLGIFKAVVGLLIRPAVGTLELLGKSAHGVGLLFLGREGISGTIQKRARAPGTLTDDSDELIEEVTRNKQLQRWHAVMAAWQRVLPEMYPSMKDDRVIEVLRCHEDRVVLLTSAHMALLACTSKPQDKAVTYQSKWTLRLHDVQNVRGNEDKMQVTVQYVHKYSIPLLGVYNVPLHKYIHCSSFEVFNSVITRLNRHLHEMAQRTQSMTRNFDFELPSVAHLSIMEAADNIP
ncbi:hypothetical protein WJX77_009530 [Trebouxia sp. C0004]